MYFSGGERSYKDGLNDIDDTHWDDLMSCRKTGETIRVKSKQFTS